jgi:hypothetical protein
LVSFRVPISVCINLLYPEIVKATNEIYQNYGDQNQTNDGVDLTHGDGRHDSLRAGIAGYEKLQILLKLIDVENLENSR